ncbi:MAG: hypothetical protein O3C33_05780 [Actinomycetota bacterium]|nr:hypothetical protein [Actinomycetota bacterium]
MTIDDVTFRPGDRVRRHTTDDSGLPVTLYGFVGGRPDREGRVVVMFDGHLRCDTVVHVDQLDLVSITTVSLELGGTDLIDDPSLRQGLVHLWVAEAEQAGLEVEDLSPLGTGVRDMTGTGYALAELSSAGQPYVLRVQVCESGVLVCADLPRRFERPSR